MSSAFKSLPDDRSLIEIRKCTFCLPIPGQKPCPLFPQPFRRPHETGKGHKIQSGQITPFGGRLGMRKFLTVFALIWLASCTRSERRVQAESSAPREELDPKYGGILPRPGDPRRTSVYRMLAVPERFENRWVITHGYVVADFEGCAIWPSHEDYERGLIANAIWLDFDGLKQPAPHRTYAEINGIFSSKHHGHMGLFQGSLRVISWSIPIVPFKGGEEPDQSPGPTAGIVTPAADARVAPPPPVAHH